MLNAVVGGVERYRAEKAIAALEQSESQQVTVMRDGQEQQRTADQLVPGDVVRLRAGDVMTADCRIIESNNLEADESSLTGESLPVAKGVKPSFASAVADRSSMLYQGTSIAAGEALGLVVATGDQTEARRGLRGLGQQARESGAEARLRSITDATLPLSLGSGALVVASGMLRGRSLQQLVGTGVSLAVASVPEGLPLLSTAAQLAAAKRLSRRGALVRNPRAMEALGRVDVVCADKTGTLTEGKLRLHAVSDGQQSQRLDQLDDSHRRILSASVRASPRQKQELTHPTDRAVVEGAKQIDVTVDQDSGAWECEDEIPFKPSIGYHASLGQAGGRAVVAVKGAPETVLPRCARWKSNGSVRALDDEARAQLDRELDRMAESGLRVLVVADREVEQAEAIDESQIESLTFRGYLGLADPVRKAAVGAVEQLEQAGVTVIMITGDHPATARNIAKELGLPDEAVLTGADVESMDESTLVRHLERKAVVARATPSHKVRIVQALQRKGKSVAMTGDGANDAPAIRLADVGIALGEGATSAARGAADLIVVNERIETIVDAIVEGRAMWASVRDAVSILIGGNLGEIGFTLLAGIASGGEPLNARQLMLVNLLTDIAPSMAVAVQPPPRESSEELLRGGPKAALGQAMTRQIVWRTLVTCAGASGAWVTGRLTRARDPSTVGLLALVGSQLGQTLAAGRRDRKVLAASLGSAAALVAIVQLPPTSRLFGCRPVGVIGLASAAGASALSVVAARLQPKRVPWLEPYLEKVVMARTQKGAEQAAGSAPSPVTVEPIVQEDVQKEPSDTHTLGVLPVA